MDLASVPATALADVIPVPVAQSRNKKALIYSGVFALAALGALAFIYSGRGKNSDSIPASATGSSPVPAPTAPAPVLPATATAPAIDPREAAIAAAKEWELPDGRKLGQALETISPPIGNLSPWMAEPLTDDRVSVNYFAHGGGAGAPTVAYEFEVAHGSKLVAGRNPAAKAVIAGRASPPPAPPKAKRVALRRKQKIKAKTQKSKPREENPDPLIGTDSAAAPADDLTAPVKEAPAKSAPAAMSGKAADEALLDDILKD